MFDLGTVDVDDVIKATTPFGLSDRECQIALLVLRGNDNASACKAAGITESTLRTHLRNIYAKTDAHSRTELVVLLATRLNRDEN